MSTLKILAPVGYPWTFTGPRASRHHIERATFLPFNKIDRRLDGITMFPRAFVVRYDLVHAFNRIPVGALPFVIGFESHLPRTFGLENTWLADKMLGALLSDRCRRIVAISAYAKRQFIRHAERHGRSDELCAKLELNYPSIEVPATPQQAKSFGEPLRLVFVGSHFLRKGGLAAMMLTNRLRRRGVSVTLDVISNLSIGNVSWIDPLGPWDLNAIIENHKSDAISFHSAMPNADVRQLIASAHLSLLPTLSDTFGFSAVESLAEGVPVLATRQAAMPEIVEDGRNGYLVDLELDAYGEWVGLKVGDRRSKAYLDLFVQTNEAVAEAMSVKVENLLDAPDLFENMSGAAREIAERTFSPPRCQAYWDNLYEDALERVG